MNPTQGVISEAFDLYKRHFGHLVVVALVIYLAIAVLGVFAVLLLSWVGAILVAILAVIGSFVVTAALVEAVADIRDGRADLSVSETLSRGLSRIGSVAGASILGGIAIGIGLILLIVPGLILITWWAVIIPVIVLEHVGTFDSFSRSRELVRGFDWQVFGVIVIQFLIFIGFGIVLAIVLAPFPEEVSSFLSNVVSGAFTGPFAALVTTLLYFRLKAAKEGPGVPPPGAGPTAPPPAVS
jgi:hypothetical protein